MATDAQQKQHSWNAYKRKGDIAHEGRCGASAGLPLLPAIGAPLGGTCLGPASQPCGTPPRAGPRGREGAREQEGALHGQVRARRLQAAGRGERSAREARILPAAPERGAPGAAPGGSRGGSHGRADARGPLLLGPPARPPCCWPGPAELPPEALRGCRRLPGGVGGSPSWGWSANGWEILSVPARPPASLCVCLWRWERLRLPQRAGAKRPPLHRSVIGDQWLPGSSELPCCRGVGFRAGAPREGAKRAEREGKGGEGGTDRRERLGSPGSGLVNVI
jgi:hypothetical protein